MRQKAVISPLRDGFLLRTFQRVALLLSFRWAKLLGCAPHARIFASHRQNRYSASGDPDPNEHLRFGSFHFLWHIA